jgi:hypothetical protein
MECHGTVSPHRIDMQNNQWSLPIFSFWRTIDMSIWSVDLSFHNLEFVIFRHQRNIDIMPVKIGDIVRMYLEYYHPFAQGVKYRA